MNPSTNHQNFQGSFGILAKEKIGATQYGKNGKQSVKNLSANNFSATDEIDFNELNIEELFGTQLKSQRGDGSKKLPLAIVKAERFNIDAEEENNQPLNFTRKIAPSPNKMAGINPNLNPFTNNINPNFGNRMSSMLCNGLNGNDMIRNICHGLVDMCFNKEEEVNSLKNENMKLKYLLMVNNNYPKGTSMYHEDSKNYFQNPQVKNEILFSFMKQKPEEKQIYRNYEAMSFRNDDDSNNDNANGPYSQKIMRTFIPGEIDTFEPTNPSSLPSKEHQDLQTDLNSSQKTSFLKFKNKNSKPLHAPSKGKGALLCEVIKEQTNEGDSTEKQNPKSIPLIKPVESKGKVEEKEVSSLKEIKDDEFDDFLEKLKKKKKTSLPSSQDPFKKSNEFFQVKEKKKKSFEPNSNSKHKLVQSDFLCGGKQVSYKPTEKTKKLMEEMDKDVEYVEDLDSGKKYPLLQKRNFNQMNQNNKGGLPVKDSKLRVKQMKNTYKIEKPITKEKIICKTIEYGSIETAEYFCLCYDTNLNPQTVCSVCENKMKITIDNFGQGFSEYVSQFKIPPFNLDDEYFQLISKTPSNEKQKEIRLKLDAFFRYQFRFLGYKALLISKLNKTSPNTCIKDVYDLLVPKFDSVFIKGIRSFLMKVSEKDAAINNNVNLQVLAVKKVNDMKDFEIELSDGYKSCFAKVESLNPIYSLIEKSIIYNGMKLNIGLAQLVTITEDFRVYIEIYYNAISKCSQTEKLGLKSNKFLIKNLKNIRTDGGEVSMINVIVIKKSEYYIYDLKKQKSYSRLTYEKLREKYEEEMFQSKSSVNVLPEKQIENPFPEEITFNFRLVVADALLYHNRNNNNFKGLDLYKKLLSKKCYIDFSVKNVSFYEVFEKDSMYRLCLLNINRKSYRGNPKGVLQLRANESMLFEEEKIEGGKKAEAYTDLISTITKNFCFYNEGDFMKALIKEKFNYEKYSNEDVMIFGVYLDTVIKEQEIKDDSKSSKTNSSSNYLLFQGISSIIYIVKMHSDSFYNLPVLFPKTAQTKKLICFNNITFKSICYYKKEIEQLVAFHYDKKIEMKNIVISLETNPYTTVKNIPKGDTYDLLVKEIVKEEGLSGESRIKGIKLCI